VALITDRQTAPRPPRRSWRDLPAAPPVADPVPPPDTAITPIYIPPADPTAPAPAAAEPSAPRRRRGRWIIAGCVAAVLVLVASAIAVRAADDDGDAAPVTPTLPEDDPGSPASVASALGPAVVQIDLFGGMEEGGGVGSGVIYDTSGLVLTAHHVVAMSDEVTVKTSDERTFNGRVVARAPERDLAIVALDGAEDLTAATIAEPGTVEVGEPAIALGSPFGFQQSVTAGIVSGLDRELETPEGTLSGLIQTDAPINPGNSGGPLADAGAKVIGINTAIASMSGGNNGVGFAVPVEDAAALLEEVKANGGVDAPTVPAPEDEGGFEIPGLGQIPGLDQLPGLGEMLEDLFGPGGAPLELDQLLEDLFGPLGGTLDDLLDQFGDDPATEEPPAEDTPSDEPTDQDTGTEEEEQAAAGGSAADEVVQG
jgi:S1-C subfamily serine protease